MSIQHSREYEFIFSLNKQADISTAIAKAQCNKQRSIRDFNPANQDHPAIVSDQAWYGKGHSHATFYDVIQKRYVLPASARSATSLEALFAAAFVMGNVQTIQPDSATNPNEYQHTITWQDLSTNKEVLYTTYYEKMGTEYVEQLSGAWLDSFTLTANRDDHIMVSYGGGAKLSTTDTITSPGITTTSFLKTLHGAVSFGAADSPAAISADVLNWTLTVNQNPQPFHLMGNADGEQDLVSKVLIGDQTVAGNFRVFVDATHRARYRDQDTCELVLTCQSPDVIDNNRHLLEITIHNLKIASEAYDEEGQTVALTLAFDEGSVLKPGADEHLTMVFRNDIDSSELLVAA